jgi:hypothetical protein
MKTAVMSLRERGDDAVIARPQNQPQVSINSVDQEGEISRKYIPSEKKS